MIQVRKKETARPHVCFIDFFPNGTINSMKRTILKIQVYLLFFRLMIFIPSFLGKHCLTCIHNFPVINNKLCDCILLLSSLNLFNKKREDTEILDKENKHDIKKKN